VLTTAGKLISTVLELRTVASARRRRLAREAKVRSLSRSFHEDAREEARSLQNTEIFQQSRRERKKVEMLFAHLKQHMKLHRLRLRGLAGAAEEFLLAATVQNLRKLVRLRPPDLIPKGLPTAA